MLRIIARPVAEYLGVMDMNHEAVALRYLRYLALRGGGYTCRGVTGWALDDDVDGGTGHRVPGRLLSLYKRGLLDREDVRAPRLHRCVWIYRINQHGADAAARQADLPRRSIPPLRTGEDTYSPIYVPPCSLLALHELRRALEARVESVHIPGEPGWRTLKELRAQLTGESQAEPPGRAPPWEAYQDDDYGAPTTREPWRSDPHPNDPERIGSEPGHVEDRGMDGWDTLYGDLPSAPFVPSFWTPDLGWLVRTGLAQKWTVGEPGTQRVTLYRITALGGVVIPLTWREPG